MNIRFADVLLRLSVIAMALSAFCPASHARHLSPGQALETIAVRGPHKVAKVGDSGLTLSHTVTDAVTGTPTVYVFSRPEADGFYIVAADDAIGDILLGYSDSSSFGGTVANPGMRWLMETYSVRVAEASAPGAPRVERTEIKPLASTAWSQGTPYNDLCPVVGGNRTSAGCVAIAVAQAMKVHQWPPVGVGSKEYSYMLVDYDGQPTVEVSSDFAAHTYRWDEMLDSYLGASTEAQREAVARLCFDAGVAASMEYSSSSAARSLDAGCGMLRHFAYDKGMRYLDRKWFAYRQWEEIIYAQLQQGRPVIYSGTSDTVGHTFLIDGADGNGFFHFNWGWNGESDGYFSLADLTPVNTQDATRSYNWAQNMLVDVTPDAGSPLAGNMAIADAITTNRSVYNGDTDYVNVYGGFYSFALGSAQYSLGFMVDTETPKYISVLNSVLDPTWGYTQIAVYAGSFPEGEYDVYPVFRTEDGEWKKMYYDRSLTSGYLHFVKADGVLTITASTPDAPAAGDVVSAAYLGTRPADGIEPRLFPGREYDFTFGITTDGECLKEMRVALASEDGAVVALGQPVLVDLDKAGSVEISLPLSIPTDVEPGNYLVGCTVRANGEDVLISDYVQVEILREWISIDVDSVDLYIGDEYALKVSAHSDLIPVLWSSSDANVAEIDSEGVIKAVAQGHARITATCGGASAFCDVTVSPVLPDSIEIVPKYLLIEVGTSRKLDVKIYPDNTTDKTVTWTCSDPGKIKIDEDGVVTALTNGYAELTATCGDVSAVAYASAFASVGSVETDDVSVTAGHGMVHVEAPTGMVIAIYGIDGSLLYRGGEHDIQLP
ncbi:MAG: C10 family peptidase, partial [Muribaculaceae bacterium]|nr:C10 family peptidase [Muribaculaceae bacterium]